MPPVMQFSRGNEKAEIIFKSYDNSENWFSVMILHNDFVLLRNINDDDDSSNNMIVIK